MARMEPLSAGEADPSVRPDFEAFQAARGNVPNLFRTLARRPGLMRATAAFLREASAPGEVPARLKELIALRVSRANGCAYCLASHTRLARAAGATDADLRAVEDQGGAPFPEPERAALLVADAVAAVGGRVPDALYARARRSWSETAMVEVVAMAAAFALFNRLANALEVEVTA